VIPQDDRPLVHLPWPQAAQPREGPHGASRKNAPEAILKKYHKLAQRVGEPEDRTLAFCIEEYKQSLDGCTEGTRRRAALFLDRFLAEVGDIKVSKLKPHHVTDHLKGKDWKQNTRHDVIGRINACLNYCVREGWIEANPLKGKVTLPRVQRREAILSAEDQELLVKEATAPFKTFLLAIRETGCRPIELRTARIEDCDLKKGVLRVGNKTRHATGQEERPVFLSSRMIELLKAEIGVRTSGVIFRNAHGEPWTNIALEKRMRRLADQLGMGQEVSLYGMRHRWTSDAINVRGMNPALVALQLGHTDLKMLLKHYLHADTEAMRKALDETG
jgi:integrase